MRRSMAISQVGFFRLQQKFSEDVSDMCVDTRNDQG